MAKKASGPVSGSPPGGKSMEAFLRRSHRRAELGHPAKAIGTQEVDEIF